MTSSISDSLPATGEGMSLERSADHRAITQTAITTIKKPTSAMPSAIGPPRVLSVRWIKACQASPAVASSAPAKAIADPLLRSMSAHPVVMSTLRTPR